MMRWLFEEFKSRSSGLWCIKMEALWSPETLVSHHATTQRHNPDDLAMKTLNLSIFWGIWKKLISDLCDTFFRVACSTSTFHIIQDAAEKRAIIKTTVINSNIVFTKL